MTDTDGDSVDSERIDSDSNIYAAVEQSDSGIEINADATPVELPEIHEKTSPPSNVLWSNTDITWIVGADVTSPRRNYYTYAADIEDAAIGPERRMQIFSDGASVQFGHGLTNPWVDAVVRLRPEQIARNGLDLELREVRQHVCVPEQNIIDEQDVVEISTANTSRHGDWLHGISVESDVNRWEIFAPISEVDVEIRENQLYVPFTENAIVQSLQTGASSITRRQDGLVINGAHTIDAEDVPDVVENEDGPTVVQGTELFAENEMIE